MTTWQDIGTGRPLADCICQHVGYCDGSCQHPEPPEVWIDCAECGGEGEVLETIHVYETGCGFSHPDVYGKPCPACNGIGGQISEASGDFLPSPPSKEGE